ncbi:hypothetical protein O9929_05560 [Vibrio lentus]|nr:hypothetical protein [Vibrio lentus]
MHRQNMIDKDEYPQNGRNRISMRTYARRSWVSHLQRQQTKWMFNNWSSEAAMLAGGAKMCRREKMKKLG